MTLIDCREAVSRMWTYLSDGLEGEDERQLEEHLGVCQRCCGELEFSRQLRERVSEAGTEHVPSGVRARLEAILHSAEGKDA